MKVLNPVSSALTTEAEHTHPNRINQYRGHNFFLVDLELQRSLDDVLDGDLLLLGALLGARFECGGSDELDDFAGGRVVDVGDSFGLICGVLCDTKEGDTSSMGVDGERTSGGGDSMESQ